MIGEVPAAGFTWDSVNTLAVLRQDFAERDIRIWWCDVNGRRVDNRTGFHGPAFGTNWILGKEKTRMKMCLLCLGLALCVQIAYDYP